MTVEVILRRCFGVVLLIVMALIWTYAAGMIFELLWTVFGSVFEAGRQAIDGVLRALLRP